MRNWFSHNFSLYKVSDVVVIVLLTMIFFIVIQPAHGEENLIKKLTKNLVFVATSSGTCSGTIIAPDLVLTMAHCYDKEMIVARQPLTREDYDHRAKHSEWKAIPIAMDNDHDLLLLAWRTPWEPFSFGEATLDQEIIVVAFPKGSYRVLRGRVSGIEDYHIVADINMMRGSSGGGVFSLDGKFLGVFSFTLKDGFAAFEEWIVDAKTVRMFLMMRPKVTSPSLPFSLGLPFLER